MPELAGLPLDVQNLIFSYIRRRSDVKALYETCKDFYDIVIPRIYRSIRLRESVPISTLCAFLNLENRALVHVRHIEVVDDAETKDRAAYENVLHLLANQLPRDILLSFKYALHIHGRELC